VSAVGWLALQVSNTVREPGARHGGSDVSVPGEAAGEPAPGPPRLFRRLVDRPVAPLPERLHIAAQKQHLDIIRVAGALADLLRRGDAVLIGDDDRAFQALVLAGPFLDLPVVDGARQRRRQIVVAHALPGAAERV